MPRGEPTGGGGSTVGAELQQKRVAAGGDCSRRGGIPSSQQRCIDGAPVVDPQEIVVVLQIELTECKRDALRSVHLYQLQLAFVIAIIPIGASGVGQCTRGGIEASDGGIVIYQFIVVIPVPIWPRIGVALVREMLVPPDFDAGAFAAEAVRAIVQDGAVVEGITVEHPMRGDAVSGTDVSDEASGRLVHIFFQPFLLF